MFEACTYSTEFESTIKSYQCSNTWILSILTSNKCINFNPVALRKAKIVYNFGLSECSRVDTSSTDAVILALTGTKCEQKVYIIFRLVNRILFCRGIFFWFLPQKSFFLTIPVIFSSPGQNPGRAIVLPPASALALAKC